VSSLLITVANTIFQSARFGFQKRVYIVGFISNLGIIVFNILRNIQLFTNIPIPQHACHHLGNICALLLALLQLEIMDPFRVLMGVSSNLSLLVRVAGLLGFVVLLGPGLSFDSSAPDYAMSGNFLQKVSLI
jgi:hypothetical protein